MRIGIDARMFGSGFGLARYVQQLVIHLDTIDRENQYVLFVMKENYEDVRITNDTNIANLEVINEDNKKDGAVVLHNNFKTVLANIPWYSLDEQLKFKKIIQAEKVDLMHFPHWNVPLQYNDPFVVTVHDLTMFHYPRPEATTLGPIRFWLKDRASRLVIRHAVNKAKHIFVTSEFTKHDVHETLRVPLAKMTVTYQAPFTNYELQITNYGNVLKKYDILKPYVLYVGAAYPHKNLEGLLKAWKLLSRLWSGSRLRAREGAGEYQLVLVGQENYFYKRLLDNVTMKQCDNVRYLGFVPDSELVELYKNASLYIFPSLYEGFGLPPLEAMAHGVPVVSSNRSCMPEVLGEAAMYVDPENYEQMADGMVRVLQDKNVAHELRMLGRQEVKKYSWDVLAKKTLEIYKNTL